MLSRVLLLILCIPLLGFAQTRTKYKPIILDPGYDHDRFNTQPKDVVRMFRAYTVSFDGVDDNDGNGSADNWALPEWVAYHMKRYEGKLPAGPKRPRPWITDKRLHKDRVAPGDWSYAYSNEFRKKNKNWYVRGHLCMKQHAWRLGENADWNTHTMLNAFPQRQSFNGGIWLDLEQITAYWADTYGEVWIITGPVFSDGKPVGWLGEQTPATEDRKARDEVLVAIPDSAFKIVIKEKADGEGLDVLAFIYPQEDEAGFEEPYKHENYLVSVDKIEKVTGLNFLTSLPDDQETALEAEAAESLWPITNR